MSPMAISWVVFACVFAGALLGMFLRATLAREPSEYGLKGCPEVADMLCMAPAEAAA